MPYELAWAGGFFSGEGSTTGFMQHGRFYPRIQIGQSFGTEELDRIQGALGMGLIHGPTKSPKGEMTVYQLSINGFEKTQAAVAMLWPWLSTAKREQARKVLLRARGV